MQQWKTEKLTFFFLLPKSNNNKKKCFSVFQEKSIAQKLANSTTFNYKNFTTSLRSHSLHIFLTFLVPLYRPFSSRVCVAIAFLFPKFALFAKILNLPGSLSSAVFNLVRLLAEGLGL